MTKITDFAALTGASVVPADDLVPVVDLSETGAARNKKMTFAELKVAIGAYTPGGTDVAVADGGTGASSASAARTNLGATTVGANVFTLTNPSAITFLRVNTDNTVDALSASAFRTAIGAGTGAGSTVTSQSGTSYTAVLADADTYIRFSNASAISFTIPPNSSVAFPVGTVIEVEQADAGALSFVAGSGVTLNSRSSDLTLAGQYAVAFAKKVATDTWTINGDL